MSSLDSDLENDLLEALEEGINTENNAEADTLVVATPAKRQRCSSSTIPAALQHAPPPTDPLSQVSYPCLLRIIAHLSPEDLCALAQTSRFLRDAASDPCLWRALYYSRWPAGPSEAEQLASSVRHVQSAEWRTLYVQRDAAEVQAAAARNIEALRDIYINMAISKRSEPLSPALAAGLLRRPPLSALHERVAAFRNDRGLNTRAKAVAPPGEASSSGGDGARSAASITCGGGCSFVELERNCWICEKGGHVHVCGEGCTEGKVDAGELLVCGITGQCFQRLLSEWEENGGGGGGGGGGGEDGGEDQGGGGGDWNQTEGMGGRLGRAFFAGYNASDKEMMINFGIKM